MAQQRETPREGQPPPESGHFGTLLLSAAQQGPRQQKLKKPPSLLGLFTGGCKAGSMSSSESGVQRSPAQTSGGGALPVHTPLASSRAHPSQKPF